MKTILLTFVALLITINANAKNEKMNFLNSSAYFIENNGQWPEKVKFLAISSGYKTWITDDSFIFDVQLNKQNDSIINRDISEYRLLNSNLKEYKVYNKREIKLNFIKNNNKTVNNIGIYDSVYFKNIYEGIDLRLNFENSNFRYDFIVNEGAKPEQIQLISNKFNELLILENELVIKTQNCTIKHTNLTTYQEVNGEKEYILSDFKLTNNIVTFNLPKYNPNTKLIIDPIVLVDDVTLGIQSFSEVRDIETKDHPKKTIFVGSTSSTDFPNAFGTIAGSKDGVIGEIEIDINNQIYNPWVTFIGGEDDDFISSVELLSSGDDKIYFTGFTMSPDFPITPSTAYFNQINGMPNDRRSNFFTVLSDNGTNLLYSTYLKNHAVTNGNDRPNIELSTDGKIVYLSGYARLNSLIPYTEYKQILTQDNSNGDPYFQSFIMAFDLDTISSNLNYNLRFASYFGGNDYTLIKDIVIDNNNNIYMCGITESDKATFHTTTGAYDENNPLNERRAFVTKLNFDGVNLNIIYNTFYTKIGASWTGGSFGHLKQDDVTAIEYNNNKIYIAGSTNNSNNVPTLNAFDDTPNPSGSSEAFVSVFELNGNGANDLYYSSYFGGDEPSRIFDLDYRPVCGYVYFSGITYSELEGYKGILNGQFYNHDIMVGALDINKFEEYSLVELAYYPNYSESIIGEAIDGGTYGDNYVYFGGVKSGDALLGAYSVTNCNTPPYCNCDYTVKNKLLDIEIEKNGGNCNENECFITHKFGPTINALCYTHAEYSATLDGVVVVPPAIHPLNPNMTFPIDQYDICIPEGAKYEITIKLMEGPEDLEPCVITETAYCPIVEPSSYCIPDCEDDEFRPGTPLLLALPSCPDCELSVQYSTRTACNGNYDIRIDALEVINNNPLNPLACSLCSFASNYELAIKEIIVKNEMEFEPVTKDDPCSNIYRIIESSCWAEFYHIYDNPIIISETPQIDRLLFSMVPCESNCCGISLTVCRIEKDKVHITNNGPIIFDEINCENNLLEIPVIPYDPFTLNPISIEVVPCSPRCGDFYNLPFGLHIANKAIDNGKIEKSKDYLDEEITHSFNNEILTIQLNSNLNEFYNLEIFDMQGRKVKEQIFQNSSLKINCSNLKTGTYYFKINNNDVIIYSDKFIKVN